MPNQSAGNRVEAALKQAVESSLLPDAAQARATQLLTRLQQPVRLALMGMPGVGKSTLLNLLVGSDILPAGLRLPTLQLSYGETPQTICTLPDGSKKTLETIDTGEITALSPVFVEMQSPLPALRKISVLEVVAPNDANAVHKASQWAVKRSDVALWCTRTFEQSEQQIWAQMPDLTKDHAFLMVTQADILRQQNTFDSVMYTIHTVAKEEFNQILAIETTHAIAARKPDGTVDKDLLRSSGGIALIQGVRRQVELGQQSAVDMAEILLQQHADALADLPDPAESEDEAPAAAPTPQSEPVVVSDAAAEVAPNEPPAIDTPSGLSRLREMAAKAREERGEAELEVAEEAPEHVAEPDPEPSPAPTAEPEAVEVAQLHPDTRAAYERVIAYIEEQGKELSAAMSDMGDDAPSEVMAMAVEHIQWLTDFLNENGDDTDMALQRARDMAFDAADLVQLMQMEKRDSAALEAVQLMLQVKRELQADLAA
ncbi:MAG: hypothetical protein AAFU41_15525 [Pseudomonadota bacterium]